MKLPGRWLGALALALLLPAAAVAADVKVGLMCPLTGKWASEGPGYEEHRLPAGG